MKLKSVFYRKGFKNTMITENAPEFTFDSIESWITSTHNHIKSKYQPDMIKGIITTVQENAQ